MEFFCTFFLNGARGLKFALFCISGLPQVQKSAHFMPKDAVLKTVQKEKPFHLPYYSYTIYIV